VVEYLWVRRSNVVSYVATVARPWDATKTPISGEIGYEERPISGEIGYEERPISGEIGYEEC
jgi:hypothetical protein